MAPRPGGKNVVFVAVESSPNKRGGRVGYFAEEADIPPRGWSSAGSRDITDVMESLRCSKTEALKIMNEGIEF